MKKTMNDERGFTLVELLVVIGVFSIVSVGFYQVMFSGVRGGQTTQDVATISQEARLGLNRMVRDTREASHLEDEPTGISYEVDVVYRDTTAPVRLRYSYHAGTQTIRLNGQVLIEGVEPIPGTPIFSYSSNRLQYDLDVPPDGVASWDELLQAQAQGLLLEEPVLIVSNIDYAFRVRSGNRTTEFYAQAQLRNRR